KRSLMFGLVFMLLTRVAHVPNIIMLSNCSRAWMEANEVSNLKSSPALDIKQSVCAAFNL
ncbi:MAG: hypothetical protein ABIV39_10685, partial [Verrucomicrobiota bacterium]